MKVEQIKFNFTKSGPLEGTINTATPAISWNFSGSEKNWHQASYQIRVRLKNESQWQEFPVSSSNSNLFVEWPGEPLKSRASFDLSVRVQGDNGDLSEWSEPVHGQVGLLVNQEQWPAKFIAIKNQPREDGETAPETLFRKSFFLSKKVKTAKIFSTALGIYNLELNGKEVAEDFLNPGWTTYEKRLLHQFYDVTELLNLGSNVIGARVGAGWYLGKFGFDGGLVNIYGEKRAISLFIEVIYEDHSTDLICSDDSWNAAYGPIVAAGLYDGETYDATKEVTGWSSDVSSGSYWAGVEVVDFDIARIEPQSFPHVTVQRTITGTVLPPTPKGKTVLDFGENIVGVPRFTNIKAKKGYKVTLRFAEVMEHGELGIRPLRSARCTDVYTFKGDAKGELYQPHFTFHGFRYCEVEDPEGVLDLQKLEAVVISTNAKQIGDFECDNVLLNQLHSNVVRSTRGNFITLPTDCPQRDERMGWTGDIAVFGKTAAFLLDCSSMLDSFLKDLWSEQQIRTSGPWPHAPAVVVPDVVKHMEHFWDKQISAIWQDCAVILPFSLFKATGSTNLLKQQYESMETWIDCLPKLKDLMLWDRTNVFLQLGDWLDPTAPPDRPANGKTDSYLVADAFLYYILSNMVTISGQVCRRNISKYEKMASQCKKDWLSKYSKETGELTSNSETAYSLAICFGLYDLEDQVKFAGNRLSEIVKKANYTIGTGFAGTPHILPALFATGHYEEAFQMLLTKECPSWLYPVTMGATTIWERWNSMMPDGTINPGEMTSFNHYALGAVASTMHELIGGVSIIEPGYRKFKVRPQPGGGLKRCHVEHESPYGLVSSRWEISGDDFTLNVTVPPNTTAIIDLPDGRSEEQGSGKHTFECKI